MVIAVLVATLRSAVAQPAPPQDPAAPEPLPAPAVTAPAPPLESGRRVDIHGFVSEGGFVSTANDYIGTSSRGSLELAEVGLNFSTEVTDRLRVGAQVFARDFGALVDAPRFDWAFLDYRWKSWLGLRAGIIRMPFGLYNEYTDIDAARVAILMPQSVYPFRNRDVLLSHRGFDLYGHRLLGAAGELDYQAWIGTLDIPSNALEVSGATLNHIDDKYVTGAQVFWQPPLDGLRIGATALRTSIDFDLTLSSANVAALIMAGLVPHGYTGHLVISQRPDTWLIGSVEYTHEAWSLAAEYSRTYKRQRSSLPSAIPTFNEDSERLYGMVGYRGTSWLQLGAYYSVFNVDANDREGHDPKFAKPYYAFQRDLAFTTRFDVNDRWLWKIEAHFINGTADLDPSLSPNPERYWGLFLFSTTVTF